MKKLLVLLFLIPLLSFNSKAQKFAFVDSEYILENMSEYRDAQDLLDKLSLEWQKEIETKFAAVDKLYKDYQAEAVLLPDDIKKSRQDAIVAKEKEAKDLQKKRFGKDGDLFKKRQELIKPIQDKVYDAIEDIATANGYAVVFDKSGSVTLLYANSKFDKSDEVLDKLGYKPGAIKTKTDKNDKDNE
ncbi:MAG: OmpH family outer membrane protein [Bacteroidota bacterium]